MKELIFNLEKNITEIEDAAKKLCTALDDLDSYYFEALCTEKNYNFHETYFDGARTRKNIADDYSRQLCELVDELNKNYQQLFSASSEAVSNE